MSSVIKAADVIAVPWPTRALVEDVAPDPSPEPGHCALLARLLLNVTPVQAAAVRLAEQTLEQAREEAAQIVATAESERDEMLEQARREGYEAGLAEGRDAGVASVREEARGRLEALRSIVEELGRARDDVAARCEGDIVELALAVAARIVRRESSLGVDTVRELLREALPRTGGTRQITVTVHPDDMAVLQEDVELFNFLTDGRARVSWVTDERLVSGGCMVETERGGIDGTVETRVTRIVESLLGVITDGD